MPTHKHFLAPFLRIKGVYSVCSQAVKRAHSVYPNLKKQIQKCVFNHHLSQNHVIHCDKLHGVARLVGHSLKNGMLKLFLS